jgi:hypothetical protein
MSRTSAEVGRRRFLQIAGLTAVASTVSSSMVALAKTRAPSPGNRSGSGTRSDTTRVGAGAKSKTAAPPDSAQAAPSEPPPISEEARLLATLVDRRFGKHLNPAQLEAVTREIDNRLQGGARLRKVRLANSDEPDFVFHA